MRHLFYLHNLPLPDKAAAQKKKIKNKIPARLYIYFPYGEISNNFTFLIDKNSVPVPLKFNNKLTLTYTKLSVQIESVDGA